MHNNLFKRIITAFFLILILLFGLFYNEYSWKTVIIFFSLLSFYEFYNLINKIFKNKLFCTILLFFVSVYFYFLYYILTEIRLNFGEEVILILLLACAFSDIGGYIIGKLIGGPKLTKLSPNKTISGSFGSIIFTVIGTSIFILLLNKLEKNLIMVDFSIKIYFWLIMMSIFCQVGDLFISYLKRKANFKDTGSILPGHGGILDRIDGIIFAIPCGVLIYLVLF